MKPVISICLVAIVSLGGLLASASSKQRPESWMKANPVTTQANRGNILNARSVQTAKIEKKPNLNADSSWTPSTRLQTDVDNQINEMMDDFVQPSHRAVARIFELLQGCVIESKSLFPSKDNRFLDCIKSLQLTTAETKSVLTSLAAPGAKIIEGFKVKQDLGEAPKYLEKNIIKKKIADAISGFCEEEKRKAANIQNSHLVKEYSDLISSANNVK